MQTFLTALLALALLSVAAAVAAAQPAHTPWKPVPGHIMTKWAADVSPDKAWPDYPRPQMVRDKWLNLNGLWDYSLADAKGSTTRGQILVPFPIESALSGVAKPLDPAGIITYRRAFTIPQDWKDQHILLHFGAVDWKAVVRINGKYAGQHTGGYDPFSFDVTDSAKPGDNEIIVEVTDPTDQSAHPIGKQRLKPESIWYTATSGIWQTAWLEPVSPLGIQSLHASADPHTGIVRLTVAGLKDSPKTPWHAVISLAGKEIATLSGLLGQEASAAVPSPQSWSPEGPALYDLHITIPGADKAPPLDTVQSYFAFRDIKVAKDDSGLNRLMLNGAPLFQFGPLDQGFWPDGLYTPPTDEAMKEDILAVKKMGGNMLRKHVKVEPDRFYYWCDKLGILVWQDMPSSFPPKDAGPDWKKNFEDELHRMIAGLKNHPCIVMWVPFNEGWGQHETADIVAKVHEWDPSRLIDNASGWTDMHTGNTSDLHDYPGPGMNPLDPARACVLGEFGGLGLPLEGHTWTTKSNWGYVSFKDQNELTDAYVALIDKIPALIAQGLCAAVYTQTTDVEIECNGWMTYDRAVWKIDPTRAAQATKKLYAPPPKITIILPCAQQSPQTWRYTQARPADAWPTPAFDDAAWKSGPSGFGSEGTPGALIGTHWKSSDIWLRRTFDLAAPTDLKSPHLSIHHDEDADIYINGTLAATLKGYTTGYILVPLSDQARAALKPGSNTLAVHCHQTKGGQNIDVGIVDLQPR